MQGVYLISGDGALHPIFESLLRPFGKFLGRDLGDQSKVLEILEALNYQMAFTSAQLDNLENRVPVTENFGAAVAPSRGLPPTRAIVTDNGRRRFVQNSAPTYAILAIISLVLVFYLAILICKATRKFGIRHALVLDEKGLAPDGFNTPSTMALLLRESNAMKYVSPDWKELSIEEFHQQMEGFRFRLG
ncbi:hypothetical protein CMUS01_10391 [Colletotrichum musicola]|uniref:Uncharacterized protein n=1 Tax=Colletotrichum musicola TaxID=2175873 RepID=A0A8H6K455_9PEZI|nr:hypothetical protein CMUS01_10391 [Colletotrichum musicola]